MRLSVPSLVCSVLLWAAFLPSVCAEVVKCAIPILPTTEADHALRAADFRRAEGLFRAQLAASATSANYAGLVHVQLEQNELVGALASAQQAVGTLPHSAEAESVLGDVLLRSGDIEGASNAFAKVIALDPCLARAHFGLARLHDLDGRHFSAGKELNLAHRLSPNDPEITAAWLEFLPMEQRATPLRSLLASHPLLLPAQLEARSTELAMLDQHVACRSDPFDAQTLHLEPLFQNGRQRRSWGLKMRINEATLPLLELDSSVDGIVLNPDDAARANVRPLSATPRAASAPYAAVAQEVHIGDLTYRNCPVTVVPSSAVDGRNSLVGTNFFRDHVLHIDYVAATLKLTALPVQPGGPGQLTDQFIAPEEKGWTRVFVTGPHILLPTFINKKGPFLFALDTGVGPTVLSPTVTAGELSSSSDATINLEGSSGRFVKVIPREGGGDVNVAHVRGPAGDLLPVTRPVKLPVYRFANSEVPDETAVSFNFSTMSQADGVEISGLLGFHLLSYFSLEINYRDSLAHIVFDQNRRYHTQEFDRSF